MKPDNRALPEWVRRAKAGLLPTLVVNGAPRRVELPRPPKPEVLRVAA